MSKLPLILVVLAFCSCKLVQAQSEKPDQLLWYNNPAANWNEALPIGNGRIGGMVFGKTDEEKIQLNEETVWAGEPGNNVQKDVYPGIQEIRRLLFAGKYEQAQEKANELFPRHAPEDSNYGMPYQTIGDLILSFPKEQKIENYRRSLDIGQAIAAVEYDVDGVHFKREYFVSYPDQVMVIHLTADEPGKISTQLGFESLQKEHEVSVKENMLQLKGRSGDVANKTGKVKFEAIAYPVSVSGKIILKEQSIEIQNADELLILVSIGTNFKNYKGLSNSEDEVAINHLKKAEEKIFSELKEAHLQDYQRLYNRVNLKLGNGTVPKMATDERLKSFKSNEDLSLVSLYFQYGRYLLISSSRPGGQPANLQGIWNSQLSPPWDSKYTVNINTEMNYWPAEATNLSELEQPLFKMIQELSEAGKESAGEMYHARGWNMHHNTDLWRITGVIDGGFYGMWPMGGAWLSQHIWQHYLFTGDKDFLKQYYPILKSTAEFFVDVLREEPDHGWLVVAPSMSPEHKYMDGVGVTYGTTMDNQLVFDVFSNLIRAANYLHKDSGFTEKVKDYRKRLPPMQIGQNSQLQEWIKDWDNPQDKHRHVSHLYGLHPAAQISPFKNPELFSAARQSLEYRGDISTGWSMAWKVNFWARLLDGDRAYKLIKNQLSLVQDDDGAGGTYPNLLDAHPPFQIDGNFGCTAGIAEMLLQSHDEALHLLPALPDEWKDGEIKGLKARGDFKVDMEWKDHELVKVKIISGIGGVCRIRSQVRLFDKEGKELPKATGENPNEFYQNPDIKEPLVSLKAEVNPPDLPEYNLYDVKTEKGKTYVFNAR